MGAADTDGDNAQFRGRQHLCKAAVVACAGKTAAPLGTEALPGVCRDVGDGGELHRVAVVDSSRVGIRSLILGTAISRRDLPQPDYARAIHLTSMGWMGTS